MSYIGNKNSVALYDSFTKEQSEDNFAPITRSRKNLLINGGFDVWQRGTSFTSNGYTADRWSTSANKGSMTVTRQPLPLGYALGGKDSKRKYYFRKDQTVAGNSTTNILQNIEDVRTGSGKRLILRGFIRTSANIDIEPVLYQVFGTGGTPSATVRISGTLRTVAATAELTEITATFDLPSVSGKTVGTNGDDFLQFGFEHPPIVCTIDIAQVQLEQGDTATDFEQRPIGEELALCQRYYESGRFFRSGTMRMSTAGLSTHDFKVTKRSNPAITHTVGSLNNCTSVGVSNQLPTSFDHYPMGGTDDVDARYYLEFTADAEL